MAKKPMTPENNYLTVPLNEATGSVMTQIAKGEAIQHRKVEDANDLEFFKTAHQEWNDYTFELLKHILSSHSIAEEYNSPWGYMAPDDFAEECKWYRDEHKEMLRRLRSIHNRLPLLERKGNSISQTGSAKATATDSVFVVYGHDNGLLQTVARYLEKLKLKPIVFHEVANSGRTIIKKFEAIANVGYAVVLLTPDDVGHAKSEPDKSKARARQNVVLELGYFMGALGRGKVAALVSSDIELPSDLGGILYIKCGGNGWQTELAKEMKHAGLPIDMNLIF